MLGKFNKNHIALLALIKNSQFNTGEFIDFNNIDLDFIYQEAVHQAVIGIVSPEIPSGYCNSMWEQAILKQKSSHIRYCHFQNELICLLNNACIPFVIIKGNSAAICYRNPTLRNMGDVDFFVPNAYFETANDLLLKNGYNWDHNTDRHISYKKDGITFELHKRFSHDIDIENYLIEGVDSKEIVSIEGFEFPILPKLSNGLVILDHIRNHLKSGIGLRQIIDWMMFVYRNLDDEFWVKEFQPVVKGKGYESLAVTMTRMCQLFLGLPETFTWCKDADIELCNQLMKIILFSGNFGVKNGKGNTVERVSTSFRNEGFFKRLQLSGEHNWKAYHKHCFLKPFCWFYQLLRYAVQFVSMDRNAKLLKSDFDRSKERSNLLKKLNIY